MSRGTVYLVCSVFMALVAAAAALAAVVWWRRREGKGEDGKGTGTGKGTGKGKSKERFDEPEAPAAGAPQPAAPAAPADYRARLTVQKAFGDVAHRKPTPEEIDRYSAFRTDAAIREAVARDHPGTPPASPSPSPSPKPSPKPATSPKPSDANPAEPMSTEGFSHKGIGKEAAADSDDEDTDDEDDEDGSGSGGRDGKGDGKGTASRCAQGVPEAYAPLAVMKDTAAPPDLGWGGKNGTGKCKGTGCRRVCMERADVLKRLEAIATEIDQFRQAVMMM